MFWERLKVKKAMRALDKKKGEPVSRKGGGWRIRREPFTNNSTKEPTSTEDKDQKRSC